jgi:hypothetical protein
MSAPHFSRLARSTKLSKTNPRFRLSGALSVRNRIVWVGHSCPTDEIPSVLETFQKYRSAQWPVNCVISQDFNSYQPSVSSQITPASTQESFLIAEG